MAKRIKHVSELPEWFQIKKYSSTSELTATGWLEQLWFRVILYSSTKAAKEKRNNDNLENEKLIAQLFEAIELIQKNPIINLEAEDIAYHDFFYSFRNYMHRKLPLTFGVRSITTADFLFLEKAISPYFLENVRHAIDEVYSEIDGPFCSVLDGSLHKLMDEDSIYEKSIAHVNWNLPNTVLIEHFKEYLIKNRPLEINDKKKNRAIDFNSWHRFGILPYIDLKIWELMTDNSIPNRVTADAIYLHGEYGEETIRKTTSVIVESIISDEEIIDLLLAEAYLEQTKEIAHAKL
jgi:hypothetical protein